MNNLNLNILELSYYKLHPLLQDRLEDAKIIKVPIFTFLFLKSADPQHWNLWVCGGFTLDGFQTSIQLAAFLLPLVSRIGRENEIIYLICWGKDSEITY